MLEGLEQVQTQILFISFFLAVIGEDYLLVVSTRTFGGGDPSQIPQVTWDIQTMPLASDLYLP